MLVTLIASGFFALGASAQTATDCWPRLAAKPFLYRFDRGPTSFLVLGTKHMGIDLDQYPAVVREVVDSADQFVFETKREPGLLFAFRSLLAMQRGRETPLSRQLGRDAFVRLVATTGMRPEMLVRLSPFGAAMMCLVRAEGVGFEKGKVSLDDEIRRRARAAKKRVGGLENSLAHLAMLKQTLDLEALNQLLAPGALEKKDARDAFLAGDAKAMTAAVDKMKRDGAEIWRVTHAARNEAWVPQIERAAARGGRLLVVAGANHLFGERGLIELFEARGFGVTRVED